MTNMDNAAQRILDVLEDLKKYPKRSLRTGLSHMFGLEPSDDGLIFRGVAEVVDLPGRAKQQLLAIEDADHEYLLQWEKEVRGAFTLFGSLENAAHTLPAQVSDVAIYSLTGCARAIAKAPGRRDVDHDSLHQARQDVADLLKSLDSSNLEQDVKSLLMQHAAAIAHALNTVRYTGGEGVEEALHAALGSAFFAARAHPELVADSTFARFLGVLDNVANVITIWSGGLQLTAGIFETIAQIQS